MSGRATGPFTTAEAIGERESPSSAACEALGRFDEHIVTLLERWHRLVVGTRDGHL
jgi:hypothetical protein